VILNGGFVAQLRNPRYHAGQFDLTTKFTKSAKFPMENYQNLRVLRAFVVKPVCFCFVAALPR
jgi:hypothetical protein